MERVAAVQVSVTRAATRADRVRRYYGRWAATYGTAADDGWFARIRAREQRIVDGLLAVTGGESILDAGCGTGVHAAPLAARGHEVWGIDVAPEMVERARSQMARASVADVCALDLGRRFDRILCLGVLEFVADPVLALQRLREHLAPGGSLVVLVPRPTISGRVYQLTKAVYGLGARVFSAATLRRHGERAGLTYKTHRFPFFHNVVMVFEA